MTRAIYEKTFADVMEQLPKAYEMVEALKGIPEEASDDPYPHMLSEDDM